MSYVSPYCAVLEIAVRRPQEYKVCVICGLLIGFERQRCPYCSGYRFDEDQERVINTALEHMTHPTSALVDVERFVE